MAGLFILNGDDLASPGYHPGLMLYRAAIPEPSGLALAALTLSILTTRLLVVRAEFRCGRKGVRNRLLTLRRLLGRVWAWDDRIEPRKGAMFITC
jgi:hypothetical protein